MIFWFYLLACAGYERFSILIFPVAILSTRHILNALPTSYQTCSICDKHVVILFMNTLILTFIVWALDWILQDIVSDRIIYPQGHWKEIFIIYLFVSGNNNNIL